MNCQNCNNQIDYETNRFLCNFCFNESKTKEFCNKKDCKYKAIYNGFCGHHISIPKPENYIKKEYNTSKKIRMTPTKEQRKILLKWFGVARRCFNEANTHLKEKTLTFKNVRDTVIRNLNENHDYIASTPLKIKQEAVGDLIKATSNAISKFQKTGKFQKIKYKSKKSSSQSIYINREAIKSTDIGVCIYPRTLGNIKTDEILSQIPTHCRITLKYGKYFYLCVPLEMKKINIEPNFVDGIVAIDPGERIFSSFYSPLLEGHIGNRCRTRFYKCFKEADKIQSKIINIKNNIKKNQLRGNSKRNSKNKMKILKKKFLSVISKPTRLAQELHYKTSLFLCKNFHTIMIPEYSSKKLASKLYKNVNRSNQALSHYSFRERLLHTAKRYKRKVHIVPESYTSMTCTQCGNLDANKNEFLSCPKCKLNIHRDKNGSRNIYIKNVLWIKNNL